MFNGVLLYFICIVVPLHGVINSHLWDMRCNRVIHHSQVIRLRMITADVGYIASQFGSLNKRTISN